MIVFVNEREVAVETGVSLYWIRGVYKMDADICIVNGFMVNKNKTLNSNDRITFIKRGEIPKEEELEALMISRHTPGVHDKVKKACVGIAGLGGLGSNIAIHLARLGVGKLILIDFDVVEPSNLNRQQYFIRDIGQFKTDAIKKQLKEINPFIQVETHNVYIDEDNIEILFKETDIVVEAFDNPVCKAYLVNKVLAEFNETYIVAASGVAGYGSNNTIQTKRIGGRLYLIGDGISEAKENCGLMAPRTALAAAHQSNTVLRIILGELTV